MQLMCLFLHLPLPLMENTPLSSLYLPEHVNPSSAPGNRIYEMVRPHKDLLNEPQGKLKILHRILYFAIMGIVYYNQLSYARITTHEIQT